MSEDKQRSEDGQNLVAVLATRLWNLAGMWDKNSFPVGWSSDFWSGYRLGAASLALEDPRLRTALAAHDPELVRRLEELLPGVNPNLKPQAAGQGTEESDSHSRGESRTTIHES